MKELKGADTQYLAMGQAIADFRDGGVEET